MNPNWLSMIGHGITTIFEEEIPSLEFYRPKKQYALELYSSAGIQIPIWRFLIRGGVFSEIAVNHSYWNYGLELVLL